MLRRHYSTCRRHFSNLCSTFDLSLKTLFAAGENMKNLAPLIVVLIYVLCAISTQAQTAPGWYYNPAQVTLTASDSGSGVGRTNFIVDGGPEQTYTGPFNVSGDGYHQVAHWSTDAVGNVEVHRSFTILVDANAPSTQFSISGTVGTNGWYRSAVQVSLAVSDTVSGVQTTFYKVDGGTTKTYLGTAFNVSGNGSHTVNYWSVDRTR